LAGVEAFAARGRSNLRLSNFGRLIRYLTIAALLLISLLVHYFLLFNYLYFCRDEDARADAVVVFDGMTLRIREGFKLLNEGRATIGIISPATRTQIDHYIKTYGSPGTVRFLIEQRARTTYENALFTSEIITTSGLETVILVTSRDHMPRAFLMLESMLIGEKVKVYRVPVSSEKALPWSWRQWLLQEKLLYNEMLKSLGSFYELLTHAATGRLAPRRVRNSETLKALEKRLMIE
jgi:uncharacterized SAM-binding protein YcdF (DUF218 family)